MNAEKEEFTVGRLEHAIAGKGDLPVEELKREILPAVEAFTRGAR